MTFKKIKIHTKKIVGHGSTDAELRSLEAKIPLIKNEEEDKLIESSLPFKRVTHKT